MNFFVQSVFSADKVVKRQLACKAGPNMYFNQCISCEAFEGACLSTLESAFSEVTFKLGIMPVTLGKDAEQLYCIGGVSSI